MFPESMKSVKFSDSGSGSNVVNIPSTWPSNRPSKTELSVQTDYIPVMEKEIQSVIKNDAKVQTDPDPTDFSSSVNQPNLDFTDKLLSRNETLSLNQFLSTIESTVSNLLIQNVRSRAFDEVSSQFEYMKSLLNPNDGNAEDIIETLYELSDESIFQNDVSLETVAIDWSKTGQSVGILYGSKGGSVWGTQRGFFCSWNLASTQLNPRKADISVEIPSSPMHLAYHPDLPNIVVVSTFTGALHLIDTAALLSSSESSYIVASSENDNHSHHEPVSSVVWISARSLNLNRQGKRHIQDIGQYFIFSAGNDGKLLIYGLNVRPDGSRLTPVLHSQLLATHVPQHLRRTGILSKSEVMDGISDLKPDVPLGISHIALPPSNLYPSSTSFLVGTESGYLFSSSFDRFSPLNHTELYSAKRETTSAGASASPILFCYKSNLTSFAQVKYNTSIKHTFITIGGSEIRIYELLNESPKLVLDPSAIGSISCLFTCGDVNRNGSVLLAATNDGNLIAYDLEYSTARPLFVLPVSDISSSHSSSFAKPSQLTSLSFNTKRESFSDMVAAGMADGRCVVWKVRAVGIEAGNCRTGNSNIAKALKVG